jgi:hypothetical protein
MVDYESRVWRPAARIHVRKLLVLQRVFALRLTHIHTCVKSRFTRIWKFHFFSLKHHRTDRCVCQNLLRGGGGDTVYRKFGRHLCCLSAYQIQSPESLAQSGLKTAGQPTHSVLMGQSIERVVPSTLRPLWMTLWVIFFGCKENACLCSNRVQKPSYPGFKPQTFFQPKLFPLAKI